MLITVYCVRRDLSEVTFSLDVDPDFELENFRALCELESGVPADQALILYAERPLTDNQRSLSSYGLKDGDVVILRQKDPSEAPPAAPLPVGLPRIDFSSIAVPGTSQQPPAPQPRAPAPAPAPDSTTFPQGLDNPALLREMLLANPHELSLLKERNPPLAEALLSGDLERFKRVLLEQQQERARREQERIRLFSADPFDLEAQAKIEEDIRQQNIEENMTIAMEEAPESFGQVVMLYINCKVNGYPVKAFVDSGAQMTIMSQACAERCHIMRLVDRRWAGIAKGVGTQKIIGRVHLAQVQIEGDFLPCSFSILEEQPMDMLLGLDMLKRHQCSIDLEKNVLVIGTTGTRTTFLPEAELPECARLAYGPGREDMRPEEIADRELAEVLQKSAEEADKETTSVDRPSLVPPTDGLPHPVHAPGDPSAPPAHSVSTQTSVCPPLSTESSESAIGASAVDAACASQTDLPPQPLGPSDSAESSFSQLSSADQDTVALKNTLTGDFLQAQHHKEPTSQNLDFVQAQHQREPTRQNSDFVQAQHQREPTSQNSDFVQAQHQREPTRQNSDFQPFVNDHEAELNAGHLPQANMEDTMDVDTQTPLALASAEPCGQYCADASQQPALDNSSHHLASSSEMPVTAVAPVMDPSNLQGGPKLEADDGCFSLAAALKELHKLLVVSGQGPPRGTSPSGPPGSLLNGSLEDGSSETNVTAVQDAEGALLCGGLDQSNAHSAIPEHPILDESKVSTDGILHEGNVSTNLILDDRTVSTGQIPDENDVPVHLLPDNHTVSTDLIPEEINMSTDLIQDESKVSTDPIIDENKVSTDLTMDESNKSTDLIQDESSMSMDPLIDESKVSMELTLDESYVSTDLVPDNSNVSTDLIPDKSKMPSDPIIDENKVSTDLTMDESYVSTDRIPDESNKSTDLVPDYSNVSMDFIRDKSKVSTDFINDDGNVCTGLMPDYSNVPTDLILDKSKVPTDPIVDENKVSTDLTMDKSYVSTDRIPDESNKSTDLVPDYSNMSTDFITDDGNVCTSLMPGYSNVPTDLIPDESNVPTDSMQEATGRQHHNLSEASIQQKNNMSEDVIPEETNLCHSDLTGDTTEPSVSSLSSAVGEATDVNGNPIQSSPGAGDRTPLVHPPAPSPSAVERIVRAGFPLHEAVLALERADGNVELALLALLAKNIVVPT